MSFETSYKDLYPEGPYEPLVAGLRLALAEVRWKIEHAEKHPVSPEAAAYLAALKEIENTLHMYAIQCAKGEQPGLWASAAKANESHDVR